MAYTWDDLITFIAGTPAKSGEVNTNFLITKQYIQSNEDNIIDAQTDILNLQNGKADLNGNSGQRFQVADAVNSKDAVNKETALDYLAPAQQVVNGFILSRYNNYTISASAGSCWDSTNTYIIKSTTSLTAEEQSISASATYYVYVVGGGTANTQLVISVSPTTPQLPIGALYFRRLGSFKTNSNAHIDGNSVINDGPFGIPNAKAVIIKSYINGATGYRIWSDGYCEQWGRYTASQDYNNTVSLLKKFADSDYYATAQFTGSYNRERGNFNYSEEGPAIRQRTVSSFSVSTWVNWNGIWKATGYLAQGEY